jgi:hypothetical protein
VGKSETRLLWGVAMHIKNIRILPIALLLMLGACESDDPYLQPYSSPYNESCYSRGESSGNLEELRDATTTLMISGQDTGLAVGTKDFSFYISMDHNFVCKGKYDVSVTIPAGRYALDISSQVDQPDGPSSISTRTTEWATMEFEFLPHTDYRLTVIGYYLYESVMDWPKGKWVVLPLILQRYAAPSGGTMIETAVSGLYKWHYGLTPEQIKRGMKILQEGSHTKEQFLAMRNGWLAENKRVIAKFG